MPDGIVFTKSQALQLFYQTGDVPDPALSGDAVNLAYFEANSSGEGGTSLSWNASGDMVYASGDPLETAYLPIGNPNQQLAVNDGGKGVGWIDPFGSGDGLNVNGLNWMTGPFMSEDTHITSRKGLIPNADDDFDDASINEALWTVDGSSVVESSGYILINDGTSSLNSNYRIAGDFDIRCLAYVNNSAWQTDMVALVADFDDDENWDFVSQAVDRVSTSVGGDGNPRMVYASINNGSTTFWPAAINGYHYEGLRLVRTGNTFYVYHWTLPDDGTSATPEQIRLDTGWQLGRTGIFTPSANNDCRVRFVITAYVGGGNTRWLDYHVKTGTIVPGMPVGPAWKIDSISTFESGEPLVSFYNGPAEAANKVAGIFADGTLSGEDMYLAAIPGLVSENLGGSSFNGTYTGESGFYGDMLVSGDLEVIGGITSSGEPVALVSHSHAALDIVTHPDEPNGFEIPGGAGDVHVPDSTISFSGDQFTIAPVGDDFTIYIAGEAYTKTGETITIDTGDPYGGFIYYDASGDLVSGPFANNVIFENCLVSFYQWDPVSGEAIFQGDERHGSQMDAATHAYLHLTFGCRYEEGLGATNYTIAGDGNSDSDATIGLGNGTIHDEDIKFSITDGSPQTLNTLAYIPVYYRSGADGNWRRKPATKFPLMESGVPAYTGANGRIAYNGPDVGGAGVWGLGEVSQGDFTAVWIIATTSINAPIVAVMDQNDGDYGTINNAKNNALFENLDLDPFPMVEAKIIYRLIFQTRTTYSNAASARLRDVVDFRASQETPRESVVTTHSSLSGLNSLDHPEGAIALTGDYSGGPISGDTTLFEALTDLNVRATRQLGWYMDSFDLTGDLLALQPLFYGEGPYSLVSANVDGRIVTSGESEWDIQYCESGDWATSGEPWVSVFTTLPTIDSGERTSQTAATPAVLKSITIPEGARVRAINTLPSGEDTTVTIVIRGTT